MEKQEIEKNINSIRVRSSQIRCAWKKIDNIKSHQRNITMSFKLSIAKWITEALDYILGMCGSKLHRHVVQTMFSRIPHTDYTINDIKSVVLIPDYVQPDVLDLNMVERIFAAFQTAKHDQRNKDAVFMPSSMWHELLDLSYPSYPDTDIDKFHFFLSNFVSWKTYTTMNFSTLFHKITKNLKYIQRYKKLEIDQKVSWWLNFESKGRDLSCLSQPRHGNQCGAIVDNHFISHTSVSHEYYGGMISNFVKKNVDLLLGRLERDMVYYFTLYLKHFPSFAIWILIYRRFCVVLHTN